MKVGLINDRQTTHVVHVGLIRLLLTPILAMVCLPAFSATNSAPVTNGQLTLQWTAPVSRSDGTPLSLSDIGGYRIYYGTSAGNYPNRIDVADGTAQAVTITDLPVGTYNLVMTTYDGDGLESAYSSMVTKSVQSGNLCDADLDHSGGVVNFADLALFKRAFGTSEPSADFNGNGSVDFADLAIFKQLYGKAAGPSDCGSLSL